MNSASAHHLRSLAETALRSGRLEDGIEAYETLLDRHPGGADDWYNLAYLQRCASKFDDALRSYGQALARGVSGPEDVHVNRAAIFSEHLADDVSAESELRMALRLAPDFPVALLNLGNIHEDRGERRIAREMYAKVLVTTPTSGRARARMAMLDVQEGAAADVVPVLQRALATLPLSPDDVGEIGFALGHALDSLARYGEAFAAFDAANVASRSAAASFVPPYDAAAHERLIDDIIAAFPTPARIHARADRSPLFVCGMFRSGSTLAEQILARHSRVTAGGELELLPSIVATRLQPFPRAASDLSSKTLERCRRDYTDGLNRLIPDRNVVTDKRPGNYLYIGLIKAIFPDAHIVHTVRDELDNALSVYFLNFDPSVSYGFDLQSIGHYYRQYRRLMAHWKSLYPSDIHDLDYDDLVRTPEPAIRALLAACVLPWEARCLEHRTADVVVRTASTWQVRQPLHTRSSGRWRHYAPFLGPLQKALRGD